MKLALASDIHGLWRKIDWPKADVLCLAGDILHNYEYGRGCSVECARQVIEIEDLIKYLKDKYAHLVLVAGNHDWAWYRHHSHEQAVNACNMEGVHYLQDSSVVIDGVKFYGSPWQPYFYDWAFNLPNPKVSPAMAYAAAQAMCNNIDFDTNVLITHGPPYGVLDITYGGEHVGCPRLAERVLKNDNYLKLHVFGHIHFSAGIEKIDGKTFVNAAILGEDYLPAKNPTVVDI